MVLIKKKSKWVTRRRRLGGVELGEAFPREEYQGVCRPQGESVVCYRGPRWAGLGWGGVGCPWFYH